MKGTYAKLTKIRNTINKWQENDFVHPLTCGNVSLHENLFPKIDLLSETEDLFELTLCCRECEWKQEIPDFFTNEVIEDDLI